MSHDLIARSKMFGTMFSEQLSCYNGGTPTPAETGSGDTSEEYNLYIYCACPPEYTGEMCEKGTACVVFLLMFCMSVHKNYMY